MLFLLVVVILKLFSPSFFNSSSRFYILNNMINKNYIMNLNININLYTRFRTITILYIKR
jgi:hypothetical protein